MVELAMIEFFASLIGFLLLVPPVVALPPGFIGTYHPATGHVNDTKNTSAYDVGNWGLVAIENKPTDGDDPTVSFESQIDFHCNLDGGQGAGDSLLLDLDLSMSFQMLYQKTPQ